MTTDYRISARSVGSTAFHPINGTVQVVTFNTEILLSSEVAGEIISKALEMAWIAEGTNFVEDKVVNDLVNAMEGLLHILPDNTREALESYARVEKQYRDSKKVD